MDIVFIPWKSSFLFWRTPGGRVVEMTCLCIWRIPSLASVIRPWLVVMALLFLNRTTGLRQKSKSLCDHVRYESFNKKRLRVEFLNPHSAIEALNCQCGSIWELRHFVRWFCLHEVIMVGCLMVELAPEKETRALGVLPCPLTSTHWEKATWEYFEDNCLQDERISLP